jgi:hypothetical protein
MMADRPFRRFSSCFLCGLPIANSETGLTAGERYEYSFQDFKGFKIEFGWIIINHRLGVLFVIDPNYPWSRPSAGAGKRDGPHDVF